MSNETMLAAVLKAYHKDLVVEEVPRPEPKRGEILVRITASGLCGTDVHIQEGKIPTVTLPYIPGHELAGEVFEIGEGVHGFCVGDHVVSSIDVTCGVCRFCRTGKTNLCSRLKRIGFERNGSHAQFAVVPADIAFKIDKDVPPEVAAVIPDSVACMYHALEGQGKLTAGDRVCIMGVGGLGFQGIQIAKYFGADVFATSRKDRKLELAKRFGADHAINTKERNLRDEIARITDGEMCDVVLDNIGIKESIQWALDICRPGGKVIIVGYIDQEFCANYQDVMLFEKEIIGVRASKKDDLVKAIKLVEKKIIDPFVYATMPLKEINEGLRWLKEGKNDGRIVLIP